MIDLLMEKKTLSCKWDFPLKYNPNSNINCYKSEFFVRAFLKAFDRLQK